MELLLSLSVPGVPLGLVALGAYELRREKRGKQIGTPLTATYIDEFTAVFYGSKRMELEQRASMSMMREEDGQGAPPWRDVDMERGVVVLRPDR